MESYYVFDIFLPILATSIMAIPIIFTSVDLFSEEKQYGKSMGIFLFLLFLIARALIPACPFPVISAILNTGSFLVCPLMTILLSCAGAEKRSGEHWILPAGALVLATGRIVLPYPYDIPVILFSGFFIRLVRREEMKRDPSWKYHQSWIIRSVREAIMIFDGDMNIISGGEGIFPSHQITPGRPVSSLLSMPAGKGSDLTALRSAINKKGPDRGVIGFEGKSYSFRFTVLDEKKGYLLTLLDITDEQNLLEMVREKYRMLINRRTILQSEDEGDVSFYRKKEEIREQISRRIQDLVERELTELRKKLEGQDLSIENITELQSHAEQSMVHIREAVSELRGEKNENQHRSGGRSTTDKGFTGASALGRG